MTDVTDFGFDANLNRSVPQVGTPATIDSINEVISSGQLLSGGNLNAKTLAIAGFSKMVAPGDDLQAVINDVNQNGGGEIQFKSGTYNVLSSLTGYGNLTFTGISASNTILKFMGPTNLSFSSSNVYNTGTITSISGGVNVTGSGTLWLANVTTNHQLFLNTRWYKIAAVTSNTTLILAEGYADNLTFPGVAYRAAIIPVDINFKEITLNGSTVTALSMTDCRNVECDNLVTSQNNVGMALTNISELNFKDTIDAANVSDGAQLTNCGLVNANGFVNIGNGGNGLTMVNCQTFSALASSSTANTGDGVNATSLQDCDFYIELSGNGGQGVEFVSGCNNCSLSPIIARNNTSDGIKLTATSSNNTIGGSADLISNGGWGINIAAASCSNNIIIAPYYSSNVSGTLNDLGTSTVVVATLPVPLGTGVSGTLAIVNGGTGQSNILTAFNALAPLTTRGDLITRDATNDVRLAVGAANTVLRTAGTDPAWGKAVLTTDVSGTLTVSFGGTGAGSFTSGNYLKGAGTGPITVQSGVPATDITGTISVASGGTGQSNTVSAFDALAPTTTRGDVITRDATKGVRLALGGTGTHLRSNGTDPTWANVALATDVTGTLTVNFGGTGGGTGGFTSGNYIKGAGTNPFTAQSGVPATDITGTLSVGAGGTGASNGTSAYTNLGLMSVSNLSGTLTVPAGGTGKSSFTAHGVLLGNSAGNIAVTGAGTNGQVLTGNTSADPTWQTPSSSTLIGSQGTQVTANNTTTETTLVTGSLAANTLGTTGGVKVKVFLSSFKSTTGHTMTFRLYIGATVIASVAYTVGGTTEAGYIDAMIVNSATNAQRGSILVLTSNNTIGALNTAAFEYGGGAGTEDTTGALTIKVTAQWTTTDANDFLTADIGLINFSK